MKIKKLKYIGVIMAAVVTMAGCGNTTSIEAPVVNESTDTDNIDNANANETTDSETVDNAKENSDESTEKSERVYAAPKEKVDSVTPQDDLDLTQDVFVKKIDGISDDFICGMDASSVQVLENSGVRYYDFEGKECDVFKTLSEAGVNYIRLRVWNDPYNEEGYGYGGGNNDIETALALGKRATEYGMKVCIDFHYSDFWADPKRQLVPKAWEGMSVNEKSVALHDYTLECLNMLLENGVDVGMVQIGNEINYGMSGESLQANVTKLLSEGSKAVREAASSFDKDIKIVVHYTNIEDNEQVKNRVTNLGLAGVDYDYIGLSYYPFWDGDFENMQSVVKMIRDEFGKEVFLAETSYCYTAVDGDGSGNSVSGTDDIVDGYPATVQGQANMLRDTMAAASDAGALGIFYWEGVWLPVGAATDDNSSIWETYGSGWASSYAGKYDTDDAGLYYGGCSWENQALFSFDGHPLPSLNTFKYVKTGHDAELRIDAVPDVYLSFTTGEEVKLPETVSVIYNDTSKNKDVAVNWDTEAASKIDNSVAGKYEICGTVDDGSALTCYIEVNLPNAVLNPSFEEDDTSMWEVRAEGADITDYQDKADDAHTGTKALHFWAGDGKSEFKLFQNIDGLSAGTYSLQCFAQGGDMTDDSELILYALVNGKTYSESFMVTKWAEWKNPVIDDIEIADGDSVEIGVHYKVNKGSWGTVDDFVLEKR